MSLPTYVLQDFRDVEDPVLCYTCGIDAREISLGNISIRDGSIAKCSRVCARCMSRLMMSIEALRTHNRESRE